MSILDINGGVKRKKGGESEGRSMKKMKSGEESDEEKEYVFVDISKKTHDGVVLTQSEHPVVVLTGIGSADPVCLNNDINVNVKGKPKKLRVMKKRLRKLSRVNKKVYDKSVTDYFRIKCKLCKEEAGKQHFKVCEKVISMMSSKNKHARIHAMGDLFDSKD